MRSCAAVPLTDIEYGVNLDESSLGLSDTTFAAVQRRRKVDHLR